MVIFWNENIGNTCEIFNCKFQSLSRWIKIYMTKSNLERKPRQKYNLKITPEIEQFIKNYVKKYPSTTLWEYSKLVYKNFNIHLSDSSIYNILKNYKLTRKRLRSKYYPEKKEKVKKNKI